MALSSLTAAPQVYENFGWWISSSADDAWLTNEGCPLIRSRPCSLPLVDIERWYIEKVSQKFSSYGSKKVKDVRIEPWSALSSDHVHLNIIPYIHLSGIPDSGWTSHAQLSLLPGITEAKFPSQTGTN